MYYYHLEVACNDEGDGLRPLTLKEIDILETIGTELFTHTGAGSIFTSKTKPYILADELEPLSKEFQKTTGEELCIIWFPYDISQKEREKLEWEWYNYLVEKDKKKEK